MYTILFLPILLAKCEGHVPFFVSGSDNSIQRPADISQVYYFKRSGKLYSKEHLPQGSPNDLVQLVGPDATLEKCYTFIFCDSNKTLVNLTTSNPKKVEPFTQTSYYMYFDEPKNCSELFSIDTVCDHSWGAVVGKKEEFEITDLLSYPITIARLHGSWWNDLYIVGWLLLVLITIPFTRTFLDEPKTVKACLLASALTNFSFFVDKLVATVSFAVTSGGAWALTFFELLPLILVYRFFKVPGNIIAVCTLFISIGLLFVFGIGFIIGNVFLFSAAFLFLVQD